MPNKWARHTPVLAGEKKIRALSIDSALMPHVSDAITNLTEDWQWEAVGDTVQDVVDACKDAVESWYSDMLIGQVSHFVDAAPPGWLELDGATYASADYPELADKIPSGWISGADFTLPDHDGVFLNGVGSGGTIAATGGTNEHTLTAAEMPSHTHDYIMPVSAPDTVGAGAPIPSVMSVTPATPTSSTGSGDPHENRPAFLSLVVAVFAGR